MSDASQNVNVSCESAVMHKPGDTLLISKPFSFVIFSSHRSQICDECWSRIELGYGECCMSCGVVRYCDFTCRARGQREHYLECNYIKRERQASDMVRLIARIWRQIRDDAENLQETDGNNTRTWDDLMDNSENLINERSEELMGEYKQLSEVLDDDEMPDWKCFVSICGKIITNCFCLRSDRHIASEPFGIGLFLLASKFDHSCSPNCTVVFQGRELRVMVEKNIHEGESPRISYVNTMMDTLTRQRQLQQNWFFQCQCKLCSNPNANGVKRSVKCIKCGSPRPVDTNNWKVAGPCSECEHLGGTEQNDLVERYKEISVLVAQISGDSVEEHTYNYLHAWCAAIMGEVCSDKDVMYIRVCHYVHTICMQHQLWQPAILYGEIVLSGFIYYFGKNSKIVAALLIRLHEASYYAGFTAKGVKYLDQACNIYKLIPGENHPLYAIDIARFIQ